MAPNILEIEMLTTQLRKDRLAFSRQAAHILSTGHRSAQIPAKSCLVLLTMPGMTSESCAGNLKQPNYIVNLHFFSCSKGSDD
jgi:hypothetical protein